MLSASFQPLISAAVTTIEVAGGLVVGVIVASKSFDWVRSVIGGGSSVAGHGPVFRDIEAERRAPTIEDHEAAGFHDVHVGPEWWDSFSQSEAEMVADAAAYDARHPEFGSVDDVEAYSDAMSVRFDSMAEDGSSPEDFFDAGWHDASEDE
ncbi:hypothetical protein [Pseudomonas sp.]|uniref:hypothetical protein n=1 Tax=Pseudomonas sp. TaxID=306 RepID=UPI0026086893|nr:hypothetical protein [Pseudomonas sp.]